MQVDAYNETIFNVCQETPEAKQEYLQEIENNVLYKRDMNITEADHLVFADHLYIGYDKWKKYPGGTLNGSDISGKRKSQKRRYGN